MPLTLASALERHAQEDNPPNSSQIVYVTNGVSVGVSHAALLGDATRMLRALHSAGVKKGDGVVLVVENLRVHHQIFWGCVLGGVIPVTLPVPNVYDHQNAAVAKLIHTYRILSQTQTTVLISDTALSSERLASLTTPRMLSLSFTDLVSGSPKSEEGDRIDILPSDVAFYQLTSGSTGCPKVIQEKHEGVISHVANTQRKLGYTAEWVFLNWLPFDHVVPLLNFHCAAVLVGCTEIQMPTSEVLADPLLWLDALERFQVSYSWSPNFGFNSVARACAERGARRKWDLSSVRVLMNAGEQVTDTVCRAFLDATGLECRVLVPAFGMAETCTCITYNCEFSAKDGLRGTHVIDKGSLHARLEEVPGAAGAGRDVDSAKFVDLGAPCDGVELRICGSDDAVLPEMRIGRLQVRGAITTPGYLSNPGANAELLQAGGWLETGDLGYLCEGRLFLTGRAKEQIVIRGANIYCYEIEDCIASRVAGVRPSFVAVTSTYSASLGTEELLLFFTPVDETGLLGPKRSDVEVTHLRQLIGELMACVSRNFGIAVAQAVPVSQANFRKTTGGKIQRRQFKVEYEGGQHDGIIQALQEPAAGGAGPRSTGGEGDLAVHRQVWVSSNDTGGHGDLEKAALPSAVLVLDLQDRTVSAALGRLGVAVTTVTLPEWPPSEAQIYAVWEAVGAALSPAHHPQIEGVVFGWPLTALQGSAEGAMPAESDLASWLLHQLAGLADCLNAPPLAARTATGPEGAVKGSNSLWLWVLTHAAVVLPHDTGPQHYVGMQIGAPIIGAAHALLSECPRLELVRHADLELSDTAMIDEALRQLLCGACAPCGRTQQLAWRGEQWWRAELEWMGTSAQPDDPSGAVGSELHDLALAAPGRLYVVTGGLGGVGLELGRMLLQAGKNRLLIIGRCSESEAERRLASAEMAEAYQSGRLLYIISDLDSVDTLTNILYEAVAWAGLKLGGVFHLAGVFASVPLAEIDLVRCRDNLFAKVDGSINLHLAVTALCARTMPRADDEPQAAANHTDLGEVEFVHFGSAVAFTGGFGRALYAAACAFQWTFAEWQRRQGLSRARTLGWCQWQGAGMGAFTPSPGQAFDAAEPGRLLRQLRAECLGPPRDVLVGLREHHPAVAAHLPSDMRPRGVEDEPGTSGEDGDDVERALRKIWSHILEVVAPRPGVRFMSAGGHSVAAVRMSAAIKEAFGVSLPPGELFNSDPTLAEMGARIQGLQRGDAARSEGDLATAASDGERDIQAQPSGHGFDEAALDTLLSSLVIGNTSSTSKYKCHGAVVYAYRHGQVLHKAWGSADVAGRQPMSTSNILRMESLTMFVVGALMEILMDEGYFGLDDLVADWLPAFGEKRYVAFSIKKEDYFKLPASPEVKGAVLHPIRKEVHYYGKMPVSRQLTVQDCLAEATGLPYFLWSCPFGGFGNVKYHLGYALVLEAFPQWRDAGGHPGRISHSMTLEDYVNCVARLPHITEPGSFEYGQGMTIASRIAEVAWERRHGAFKPFSSILRERLLHPLGMRDSFYFTADPSQAARVVDLLYSYSAQEHALRIPSHAHGHYHTEQATHAPGGTLTLGSRSAPAPPRPRRALPMPPTGPCVPIHPGVTEVGCTLPCCR
ncbi:hypothetical protein CYMTET_48513 [Cymbomonas tetramitiformis]|uniref:Carrier domain-containing protein n=1 Tax=Cymbomonas tetramitiformis TaxID=36881 RepID=A0AAE0EVI4_9CHLO|nr:hypothetical protein CYMTET_48513 [Cymbomonas tetramitiformis]